MQIPAVNHFYPHSPTNQTSKGGKEKVAELFRKMTQEFEIRKTKNRDDYEPRDNPCKKQWPRADVKEVSEWLREKFMQLHVFVKRKIDETDTQGLPVCCEHVLGAFFHNGDTHEKDGREE